MEDDHHTYYKGSPPLTSALFEGFTPPKFWYLREGDVPWFMGNYKKMPSVEEGPGRAIELGLDGDRGATELDHDERGSWRCTTGSVAADVSRSPRTRPYYHSSAQHQTLHHHLI